MGKMTEVLAFLNNDPSFEKSYRPAFITITPELKEYKRQQSKEQTLTFESMSEEKSLVKSESRSVKVLDRVFESLEGAKEVCEYLLRSKLCPIHFYETGSDNKPDYSKGKVEALTTVAWHGYRLGWDIMTSMQQIVPVNGLISIKGDGAKSLIFGSGKLKMGSWRELEEGSIDKEDFVVSITAARQDNGTTMTRSFSVAQAKRAGLWITTAQANGSDGWKYKRSAWYKYPARMIYYRALGFLARDLFSDVMQGTYTMEEAADMPVDQAMVIDQGDGTKITIQDSNFAKERSEKMTKSVVDKIKQNHSPIEDVASEPVPSTGPGDTDRNAHMQSDKSIHVNNPDPDKRFSEPPVDEDLPAEEHEEPASSDKLTLEQMTEMETDELLKMVQMDSELSEALLLLPGKNTNKKLRELIYAYQCGILDDFMKPHMDAAEKANQADKDNLGLSEDDELIKPSASALNKFELDIPAFDKGNERDFKTMKVLYDALKGVTPPIGNESFLELQQTYPDLLGKFATKQAFCQYATVEEVCELLNKI